MSSQCLALVLNFSPKTRLPLSLGRERAVGAPLSTGYTSLHHRDHYHQRDVRWYDGREGPDSTLFKKPPLTVSQILLWRILPLPVCEGHSCSQFSVCKLRPATPLGCCVCVHQRAPPLMHLVTVNGSTHQSVSPTTHRHTGSRCWSLVRARLAVGQKIDYDCSAGCHVKPRLQLHP